jgi:hypothetical protein
MHDLPSAVSLARALLALHRGRSTGVLRVCSGAEVCRLAVVDGIVRAAAGQRDRLTLGDVLMRSGDLDGNAHRRALSQGGAHGPVGGWLVDSGLATRPAVEHALRRQLQARIVELFRSRGLDYTWTAGVAEVGVPWVSEPMATPDLVLSALRGALSADEAERHLEHLGDSRLVLSELGEALLRDAALWPDEAAMAALLRAGCDVARVHAVTGGSPRAAASLAALVLLSGVRIQESTGRQYQLLVRKRMQVRRGATPNELLDLPSSARAVDARRALRRLASAIHPDALGPDAPAAVRSASTDLMAALARAEERVRAATASG